MKKHLSYPAKILFSILALSFMVACWGDEPDVPTPTPGPDPGPNPPVEQKDTKAPTITVSKNSVNIISGPVASVSGDELKIGDVSVASWKDDTSKSCKVEISFVSTEGTTKTINSGNKLSEPGKLKLTVTDEAGNSSTDEITLTSVAVYGLENLQGKTLQVDQEINLLEGLTFAEGLTLQKVEIVQGNVHIEIENPRAFKPEYPGSVNIIFTLTKADGSSIEVGANDLTIRALDYTKVSIADMNPYDILPLYGIGPIERGDNNVYDYIDNLRIAEAMRIREMMGKYGVGNNHSEDYLRLMSRLNLVMRWETPDSDKYDNFEWLWESIEVSHSTNHHANNEMGMLTVFAGEYANIIVTGRNVEKKWYWALYEFAQNNPNSIIIACCSSQIITHTQEEFKNQIYKQGIIDLFELKNLIFVSSGGDTEGISWVWKDVLFNGQYEASPNWKYNYSSLANSDQNNHPNSHEIVSTWTNPEWHADITNAHGSCFPVGFADDVLFAGFAFPYYSWYYNCYYGDPLVKWAWEASYWAYINGGVLGLLFQLHADLDNVDQLLQMARSTCIENSISLEGKTQKLQRLNPAGYFKEYCMTVSLPSSIALDETIDLTKEWYKGLIFDIPGAEVKVNGEWIAYDARNSGRIKTANPMDLEWRINGDLLRKYGYISGQTVQGQILTVDDQWNGLRLEVPISIILK